MLRRAARTLGWFALGGRAPEWRPASIAGSTVVFSPHFDDETLGAGASTLRLRECHTPVHIVFMTDGSRSHTAIPGEELAALRHEEGVRAANVLGVAPADVSFLGYPETRLATCRAEAIDRVAGLLERLECGRVLVPSLLEPDVWSTDHRTTTEVVFAALARSGRRCEVVEYLVWFWYHWPWVPILGTGDARQLFKLSLQNGFGIRAWQAVNASVSIDAFRARKQTALGQHRTQITRVRSDKPWPVLGDVARGEFLDAFFRSREWLRTGMWEGARDA
ncbi:MAG: PIG-L family deacetylase [Burkholderiales bacterium]|nr:PIG-L family deacetylase [Burkholderiales bacterium]